MKRILPAFIAVVFSLFIVVSCQMIKEPAGKEEAQIQKEAEQRPSEIQPQQKQSSTKPETKEPQLIWQKDFGAEIRRFQMYKTIDPTDFPVMAVETKDELIIFYKKRNETIRRQKPRLELEQKGKKETYRGYVIVSDNGKYVLEGRGVPEFSYDLKYTTVDGKTLWEEKDFYGLPIVSPDGSVVVLLDTKGWRDKKGSVKFYDNSGKLLKQYFMDLNGIENFAYAFAFSEDGNYFILQLEAIILFDKKGNLLWQKNIETTPGRTSLFALLISQRGSKIAYSSDKDIYIVDKKGNLLWKDVFHNLYSFSTDEDILLMGSNGGFLIVDSQSGKKIWSKAQGYPILSPDEILLAVIGEVYEPTEEKLALHILNMPNKKENLIMKDKYVHPMKRKFQFSLDSKFLYFVKQEETNLSVYRFALSDL